ncbi:radical SAM-linked protein [Lachnospiraceae bacterium RM5]|nr:radical SAM-linked protein [Lachnospiraceae bacterium RM5]
MKLRIKFEKYGSMKFIGHLDTMRYFQKVMRRADIDIAYSEGFSPHQKMSFASPLGVGLISRGEYFDIEINSLDKNKDYVKDMNDVMVDGFKIVSVKALEEGSKKAMSLIAAADYKVYFRDEYKLDINYKSKFDEFMSKEEIIVIKKTKKSEKEVDIKPMIYDYKVADDGIFLKLASGSENNLKPELVIEGFYKYLDKEFKDIYIINERLELYGNEDGNFVSLEDYGKDLSCID